MIIMPMRRKNHIPVDRVERLLIGEHDELLVECAQGMGDQKKQSRPEKRSQSPVEHLKAMRDVHGQEHDQSDPEGRALESLHLHRGRCDELGNALIVCPIGKDLQGDDLGGLETGPSHLQGPFSVFDFFRGCGDFQHEKTVSACC